LTAPDDLGRMQKHSLVIAGHRTSVSLEAVFWAALRDLAWEKGVSIAALAAEIDSARGSANLSSALRVHVLQDLMEKAAPLPSPLAGEGGPGPSL
jgi:predicted DNA-binding ribbon-helix-helix protein